MSSFWMPGVVRKPLARNYTNSTRKVTNAIVLHVAVSESASLHGWFNNPRAGASSHFYVRRNGVVEQYIPINKISWAGVQSDQRAISVETQGMGHGAWTAAQVSAIQRIIKYCQSVYPSIPSRVMRSSKASETGIGWHALGVPATQTQKLRRVSQTGGELWSGAVGKVCLPVDTTEYLTEDGFKTFDEIDDDTRVASVNMADGTVSFGTATKVEPFEADVVNVGKFESTADHEWAVKTAGESVCLECGFTGVRRSVGVHRQHTGHSIQRSDTFVKIPASELSRSHTLLTASGHGGSLDLTDAEVRIAVWLFADAHYSPENHCVEWHFAKQRKVDRVLELLDELGVDSTHITQTDGTQKIRVWGDQARYLWSILPSKSFDKGWLGANLDQIHALWDELPLADGDSTYSHNQKLCFSMDKESLDTLQAASVLNGVTTTMWKSGPLWWLRVRKSVQRPKRATTSRRTTVACLTTDEGTLIIRQNGRVTVTGNCPGPDRIKQIPGLVAGLAVAKASASVPGSAGQANANAKKAGRSVTAKVGVIQVQQQLKEAGYYRGLIDGSDGPMTAQAVLAYQKGQRYFPGLLRDGIWGDLTQAHFEWVKRLQTALNAWKTASRIGKTKVDGDYGAFADRLVRQTMTDNFRGAYAKAVRKIYGRTARPVNDGQPGRAFCHMIHIPAHPTA